MSAGYVVAELTSGTDLAHTSWVQYQPQYHLFLYP